MFISIARCSDLYVLMLALHQIFALHDGME